MVRGSWLVKAHHHSGRAPHVGALTKHGISCPIVGACTWQARYGYVNIMHADICVCFHALRVHHRFRQVGPYAPGRWPYFFCEPHSFPSPACDIVGDAQRASRYALRASRSVVVSLSLSRRNAASVGDAQRASRYALRVSRSVVVSLSLSPRNGI